MKKISILLTIFSSIAITHPLKAAFTDGNSNSYDIKEDIRKFREKHGKPQINPVDLKDYKRFHRSGETENEYLEKRAGWHAKHKNEILDIIEKDGSDAIISDTSTEILEGQWHPPLIVAIDSSDLPFIKFLLQHGANPYQGITYTLYTANGAHDTTVYPIEYVKTPEIAQYLKENGASLDPLFDYSFNTQLLKKHPDLRKYLENEKATNNWNDLPRFIQPHILKGNSYNLKDDTHKFKDNHMADLHNNAHYSSDYNPEDCNPKDRTAILTTYQTQVRAILEKIYIDGHSAINTEVKSTHCAFLGFGCKTTSELPIASGIKANDFPLIKFLLEHGANPNEPTKHSSYPIAYAKSLKMIQYLHDNGADLSPLFNDLDSSEIKNVPGLREYLEKSRTQ